MEVRRRAIEPEQGRRIESVQRPPEPFPAGGAQRAHVVANSRRGISVRRTDVAGHTIQSDKLPAPPQGGWTQACRRARRIGRRAIQGGDISGQLIEVLGQPGLRFAVGWLHRLAVGVEQGRREQPIALIEAADLALEILHLVKIARPVQRPLAHARLAPQVEGVAQAFTELGQIPGSPIVAAVEMAGRATHVTLLG